MKPYVLGISASHNGAYCLLHGDEVRVAIQEERLTGVKRARVYGARRGLGLNYCLQVAGIVASDLDLVMLSCSRSAKAEENDIWLRPELSGLIHIPRRMVPHHLAHAASALALSAYESAAILVVDGQGSPIEDLCECGKRLVLDPCDGASEHLSLYHARLNSLVPLEVHATPNWVQHDPEGMWSFFSLGGMYSAVAQQIFGDCMHAGKVMGLAPYGKPCFPVGEFLELDGAHVRFTNLVQRRFRYQERWPAHENEYRDLASSVQHALEVALMHVVGRLRRMTNESNLCIAGGVGLNSVVNQRICLESGFQNIYIVPAAEDSGVAVGAAYLGYWQLGGARRESQVRSDASGRTSTAGDIEAAIESTPDIVSTRPPDLLDDVAGRLSRGQIGGWFQGGSELGPRALGQRSILCSPSGHNTKDELNRRVKFREAFRPFAPAVLTEHAAEWFDFGGSAIESPFMLRVVPVRPERRELVPAVVHVDGTGRVQTVTAQDNGVFYDLLQRFYALTGLPMLLNTSMNIAGEPIAETPSDALWCLLGTGLDFCVIGDRLITKTDGFHTVLDYIPALVADECTLRLGVLSHAFETSVTREDAVTVRTRTPWGESETVVPLRLVPLLAKVNGRRDGHAIVREFSGERSPQSVLNDLLLLRRMYIVRFLPIDVSGN
jgi:carbamoyltransferase